MEKPLIGKCHNRLWLAFLLLFFLCFRLFLFNSSSLIKSQGNNHGDNVTRNKEQIDDLDSICFGRYIYIHDLPTRFNDYLLKNCKLLMKWFDMCPYLENSGFGPQVKNPSGANVVLNKSWFSTNQFMLEIIFRERLKQYRCLTKDSSKASAIYVPYYVGLDVGRYLWDYNSSRDSSAVNLIRWVASKPEWKRMWGRDHFFVAGRIAWDFHRKLDKDFDWGSVFMSLPESKNMTMLSIESSCWSNEFAIPYPTYFHPSSESEVVEWKNRMRTRKRKYLFSFSGAPRPNMNDSIRGAIIKQCLASNKICRLLDCSSDTGNNNCDNPIAVMNVFQNSIFCLQPPGDSYTRRSTFDSILAGCIPVFFHPGSAYDQYKWHFPKNYSKYSIFIQMNDIKSGKTLINETLLGVSNGEIEAMREEVIELIPKILYTEPRANLESLFDDAFSVTIKRVLERVENLRRVIREGKDPSIGFAEEKVCVR